MAFLYAPSGERLQIRAILACDHQGVIGYDNKLVFNNPDDLEFFKKTTTDRIVVMGRRTFESIGRILPNRQTVIVSKQGAKYIKKIMETMKRPDNTSWPLVTDDPVGVLPMIADQYHNYKIYICGGATLYNFMSRFVTTWIVTKYNCDIETMDLIDRRSLFGNWGDAKNFDRSKLVKVNPNMWNRFYCASLMSNLSFNGYTYTVRSYLRPLNAGAGDVRSIKDFEEDNHDSAYFSYSDRDLYRDLRHIIE